MTIADNGIFSPEARQLEEDIVQKNQKIFTFSHQLNKLAHKALQEIRIHQDKIEEIILFCLFLKIVKSYQAVIVLIQKAFSHEANTIVRSIFETLIVFKYLYENQEKAVEAYIRSDFANRIKLIREIQNSKLPDYGEIKSNITQELIDGIESEIGKDKWEGKVEQLAKKVGLDGYYSIYRLLCLPVHAAVRSLNDYMIFTNDRELKSFSYFPKEETTVVLNTNSDFMLRTIIIANEAFNLNLQKEIKCLETEFLKIFTPQNSRECTMQ